MHFTVKIQNKLGRMGLRPGPIRSHLFLLFFRLGLTQTIWMGWTQPARPGYWSKPVTWLGTVVGMRELVTHACNSNKVIILPLHSNKWLEFARRERGRTYLVALEMKTWWRTGELIDRTFYPLCLLVFLFFWSFLICLHVS